jgi:uncharacterized membrane-anchored protein YitT (DUF2179 family)
MPMAKDYFNHVGFIRVNFIIKNKSKNIRKYVTVSISHGHMKITKFYNNKPLFIFSYYSVKLTNSLLTLIISMDQTQ